MTNTQIHYQKSLRPPVNKVSFLFLFFGKRGGGYYENELDLPLILILLSCYPDVRRMVREN